MIVCVRVCMYMYVYVHEERGERREERGERREERGERERERERRGSLELFPRGIGEKLSIFPNLEYNFKKSSFE